MTTFWVPSAFNSGFTSPSSSAGWLPTDDSDTRLWLRAGVGQTVATGLSAWENQAATGSGYNATQGTTSAQPALGSVTLNSKPGVTFDGSNDYLEITGTGLNLFRNLSGYSIFYVIRWPAASADRRILTATTGTSATNGRVSLGVTATDTFSGFARRQDSDAGSSQFGNFAYVATSDRAICHIADITNTDSYNYSSNISSAVTTNNSFLDAGATSDTASQVIRIGSSAAGTLFFNGTLFELIVVGRALTNAVERGNFMNYLGTAFGLTITP